MPHLLLIRCLSLSVLLSVAYAQAHGTTPALRRMERVISGRVTGNDGPLPGASIVVKGTTVGTTTDTEGKYTLRAADKATTLVVSYIGYLPQEIAIGNRTTIDIVLQQDANTLSEMVVVGYGTQRKSDLTGSISSIKAADITQLPTQRVDQALQGRAAGVMVLNTDGAPGGNTTIRVRGMNSINGGNNALIVIDGLQGGNLNSLNPNDIENIEVLKDASATAIYGSQGANGVILITTKMGKKGKPMITYSYNIGVQNLRNKLDVMNAADFARTVNANIATQTGSGNIPVPMFTDAQIRDYEQTGGTDWQDVVYRTATLQNHQLSISGGTENLRYLVSGGYLDQQGILVNSSYKRFSLRANLNTDITKRVRFGLNWAGSKEAGNSPPFGDAGISFLGNAVNVAPRWAPTEPVYDANGNYSVHRPGYGASDTWNPLASAMEPYIDNNTIRNTLNGYLEFDLLKDLKLRITGGAIIQNLNNQRYYNLKTKEGVQYNGSGTVNTDLYTRYQNSNILTYDKTFGVHRLTATGVVEQQFQKSSGSGTQAKNFLVDQTGVFDLAGAGSVVNSSSASERVINSYLGRINYSYKDKYLLTASYRADGSSVFGKNNKWGYFPSASVAWNASEEEFIRNLNVISNLKVRASWGVTGNQAISPYGTLARISSGSNYPYNGNNTTDLGFYIASAANPDLKWESTTQTNLGLDVAVLRGRLTATVDYYHKTTKDLLLYRELPGYTGLANILSNIGSVENKGIELALGGDPLVGAFKWNTNFNVSANRNKVLDLGTATQISYKTTVGGYGVNKNFMYLAKGEPFGQMYGWQYEGVWKTGEAEQAARYGQLPGDPRYTDLNNDGVIDTKDIKAIGNAFPKFIFGWSNRMTYKAFELNFLIQGTKGNDIFNQGRIRLEGPGEGTSARLLDRWTPDNQDTDVPGFIDGLTRQQANLTNKVLIAGDQRLSRWVEDGSYIRLKTVTLSYNVPQALSEKVKLSRVRAYVSGTNLITLTTYSGYDPEVSSFNGNDAQIGVDFSNYPPARILTFGIDVSF
ncbi:SusC/RagA family TonB-linked outer membrane protein [Larkinella insperata]|uniref:SusC/RagA family TonB-linked outer membrane protein n=1 Tax=Larkinella insperata TaxID=332158 RepID=A0ABW3Q1G6_9BACT|nr:TonB-dependent receptor [Larkinella insperata]